MKNVLFGLLATVMLLATSCIFDEPVEVPVSDGAQVSFNLGIEDGIGTRAISDGEKATKLVYAIYKVNTTTETAELLNIAGSDENGQIVVDGFSPISGYQTEPVALAKGQAYCAVFWAQNPNTSAYTTTDLTDVKVNYGTGQSSNNNEARDAFFASLTFIAADGMVQDVTLRRPFAQINVGVFQEDWDQAVAAGFVPEKSSVKIKNAATSINLLTGAVGDETTDVEVNYVSAAIPNEPLMVDVDGDQAPESYKWLSMSYILVPDHSGEKLGDMFGAKSVILESAEFAFSPKDGEDIVLSEGLNNVPVQRNWRTNIIGRIFTGDVQFNITLDPSYYNDYYVEYPETYESVAEGVKAKDGVYYIENPQGFDWLNEFLSDADNNCFEGKVVKLLNDIDLTNLKTMTDSYPPIGSTGERDSNGRLVCNPFKGTFDGQGYTVKGLYQSGWDMGYEWGKYGSLGLFSSLENATVKNVVLEGMEAQVEGGDIAFIAGSAEGTCVFENITIKNSVIGTYNNGCGGIIGWSGAGNYTFKDITLAEDVVLGGLWGSFDSSIGGIVGQAEPGATYNFENVEINCRIDAYNDCTASYDYYNYRMCGMIVGRCQETTTIDGANYPDLSKYNFSFNNVTVNYGDWMNYHYCRVTGERAVRVEPGFAYGGIASDRNHVNDTAHCMECIPFDQLIGGDQYAVKGLREVAGVTVNYPDEYTCPLCGNQHNAN